MSSADFTSYARDAFIRLADGATGAPMTVESDPLLDRLARLLLRHAARVRASDGHAGPYMIGITGSVAVGKSTISEILRALMPDVEHVATDSFLYPNDVLERQGRMTAKGFPESYDVARLLAFLGAVRNGDTGLHEIPVYSQADKDILSGVRRRIRATDALILEGVNLLTEQFYHFGNAYAVRDFVDCAIYLDAEPEVVRSWFLDRFRASREAARRRPTPYFARLVAMPDAAFEEHVEAIWSSVNLRLLNESILPNRHTVDVILDKAPDHTIRRVHLHDRFRRRVGL